MRNKFLFSLVLCCLFVSCKTSKQATVIELQKKSTEERLTQMIQTEISYRSLSSMLRLSMQSERSTTSVDAQLRIIKNEAILLSLRVPILGTEAFRMVITPDQLVVIDRLNKQYLQESMSNIQSQVPFDFDYYSLEAMWTNRLFIAGKKEITEADFATFHSTEETYQAHLSHADTRGMQYQFTADYSNRIQQTRIYPRDETAGLECTYTDWGRASNNRMFPMSIQWTVHTPNETFKLNCSLKSVGIDTNFNIEQNIPGKYQQVTLQQVIKLIGNLL